MDGCVLRGNTVLFRRNHHRDQLRNLRTGWLMRFAIALPPTEYLIGVHIVSPGQYRDRRAWRIRRRNVELDRLLRSGQSGAPGGGGVAGEVMALRRWRSRHFRDRSLDREH